MFHSLWLSACLQASWKPSKSSWTWTKSKSKIHFYQIQNSLAKWNEERKILQFSVEKLKAGKLFNSHSTFEQQGKVSFICLVRLPSSPSSSNRIMMNVCWLPRVFDSLSHSHSRPKRDGKINLKKNWKLRAFSFLFHDNTFPQHSANIRSRKVLKKKRKERKHIFPFVYSHFAGERWSGGKVSKFKLSNLLKHKHNRIIKLK